MDEIVKKLAGLGLPGVILVVLTAASGGSSAAVTATLTMLGGPFGIVGAMALFGLITVVGDIVAGYGIEVILKAIYVERSKTESVNFLINEIKDLPITEDLKLKLKNQLCQEMLTDYKEVQIPKQFEIVVTIVRFQWH
ncbi:hypothetical protein [Nostoc sp. 'Peltigera membranacea cyanobiont' 232]|uniref:hypothetical protein n=1 Tax=Nostoc sp. 'Peltigera membranacea cyanobiont' 232 TaxID=2014531 RepID=UPI000B95AC33|nr:hypothetical protein [Nostoc sp. 'Peltigera membranacea cyanobiont' 232]OYE02311.1 hypothetical protein CDG79_24730 [Nostoc sp. 'Peltigera membranacea cyanobiont' 232]